MTNSVLFIASLSERYYYEAFVLACEKKGIHVYILDPEHFVETRAQISVFQNKDTICGTIELVKLLNDTKYTTKIVDINSIKVAWYIRVNRTQYVNDITNEVLRFQWSETMCLVYSLLSALDCAWINTRESVELNTSNKLFQQLHANKSGIRTPNTVISNVPSDVICFSKQMSDTILTKTIGYTSLGPKDDEVIYSEIFTTDELEISHDAIRSSPIFCQAYVGKKYEYRVMVIGEETLACRIDSQSSNQTKIDWRHYDFANVEHVYVPLPSHVSRSLVKTLRACQLQYGAIDLIETQEGEFIFLEINPSGQWEWIEQLADVPIVEAVVSHIHSLL